MHWTKQPPTEPGWYWRRHNGHASIVHVETWYSGGLAVRRHWEAAITPKAMGGEWYGPLQAPAGEAGEDVP